MFVCRYKCPLYIGIAVGIVGIAAVVALSVVKSRH
jgi:hypothetical protein